MKRLKSVLLALSLLICTVSCGAKKESEPLPETTIEAELLSFRTADIGMANDFSEVVNTDKRGAYFLIFGAMENGDYCGYMTDTNFTEQHSFTLTPKEGEEVKCAAIMPGGKSAVLTMMDDRAFIYTFTKDMVPENTYELEDIFDPGDTFAELLCTDDGFYINAFRHDIAYIDKEGNYVGNVKIGSRSVCGLINDKDGTPCALLSEDLSTTLATLSGGEIAEETKCGDLAQYTNAVSRGDGDYRIAVVVNDGLYGLAEDKWVKLSDFSDNDFATHAVRDIEMISPTEFTAVFYLGASQCSMRLLTQRDISEIKQKRIIRLAHCSASGSDDPYDDLMKKYNSNSVDYKLEIVRYIADYPEDPYEKMKLDIIAGNAPDIVCFNGDVPVETYGDESAYFVDMYDLIDKDNDISRDDFLEGFLEGFETNGRLLQLNPTFSVKTLMVKDKFTGGLTNWNMEQFKNIVLNRPADMEVCSGSNSTTMFFNFDDFFNYDRFYNKATQECFFDSPEFIEGMKFVKENGMGVPESEMSHDGIGRETLVEGFRNDNYLIFNTPLLMGFYQLIEYVKVFGNEPSTFIGFPNEDGITGVVNSYMGYGIMANSKNIDGAWDFLKYYMFSEDSYPYAYSQFHGLEKFYKRQLEEYCQPAQHLDLDTGEMKSGHCYSYYPNATIEDPGPRVDIVYSEFSEEEAAKYDAFVREAVKHPIQPDRVIRNILAEELDYYFEGEKSAEEVAKIIQNRVSTYLSEQF